MDAILELDLVPAAKWTPIPQECPLALTARSPRDWPDEELLTLARCLGYELIRRRRAVPVALALGEVMVTSPATLFARSATAIRPSTRMPGAAAASRFKKGRKGERETGRQNSFDDTRSLWPARPSLMTTCSKRSGGPIYGHCGLAE